MAAVCLSFFLLLLTLKKCDNAPVACLLLITAVYLHVDMEYPPAERLYQKMGYGTIAEDPAWKKLLSGVQLRYMSKSLAK